MVTKDSFSKGVIFYVVVTFCILLLVSMSHGFHSRVGTNNSKYDPDALANRLEKEYDINIMWKGRGEYTRFNNADVKADLSDKREKIYLTMMEMKVILKRLPDGLFTEMKNNDTDRYYEGNRKKYSYIDIYLCNSIDSNYDIKGSYAGGLTGTYSDKSGIFIMMDIDRPSFMRYTFAHELFHMMGLGIWDEYYNHGSGPSGFNSYESWIKCNPAGYKYVFETMSGNYNIFNIDLSYDIGTESKENIYFVSKYAQYSIHEDMAETFMYLLASKGGPVLPKAYRSPNVQRKAKLIIDIIDRTYSTINKDAYWNKVFDDIPLEY